MTLAAAAYAPGRAAIEQKLADPTLPTGGQWSLVWYGVDDANQVFIARDHVTGQQAVAIRGSVVDPRQAAFWLDWFRQDLSVFRMADWPYGGAPSGARLAHGALSGLGSLLSLKDAGGQTVVAFLRANRGAGLTAVVGHSLGGALAYVLAPYLEQELGPGGDAQAFWPVTFAAPTVGNQIYADWLATTFNAAAARYWNSEDIVPHAWWALPWIAASFPSGPAVPAVLADLVRAIRDGLALFDDGYVQPGDGRMLAGKMASQDGWFGEAGHQHAAATYLSLLNVRSSDV